MIELAWRMVLKEKFPEKSFCVEAENSEQNYGPVITFYQVGRWLGIFESGRKIDLSHLLSPAFEWRGA
ncbi:hypothetical protein ACOI9X_05380 [Pseudomonas sp. P2757]|uniref:hypothetical protein n=1 Tax=unclassified Pseudomonas TaxID=196821 RepID=UPI003B59A7E9